MPRRLAAALAPLLIAACEPASPAPGEVDAPVPLPQIDARGPDATLGAVQYPIDTRHSPITAELADHLVAIAARGPGQDDRVFAKIGDSITESSYFLRCFDGGTIDLDGRDALTPTLDHFRAGDAAGVSPYLRDSVADRSGWSARGPLSGEPSYLDQELAAIAPRYASLMFGTNDVGYRSHDLFGSDLWTIVDTLLDRGVIPVMSTIPPRDDDPAADARVPLFNLVIRALAQGRGVPLVDYHRELAALPGHGLIKDGVHPSQRDGGCVFTVEGLQGGMNLRNLLVAEGLDRARRVVATGAALDADAPRRTGAGTHADPILAGATFVDLGDTRGGERVIDAYDGCAADQDERGPEIVYELTLAAPAVIEASVVDAGDTDVDVHILAGADDLTDGAACAGRGHEQAVASVGPGTVRVVVDTFVDDGGVEHAGEFLVVITAR